MALTNRERIDRGFTLLSEGLFDLVDPVMTEVFGSEDWPTRMAEVDARKQGGRAWKLTKSDPPGAASCHYRVGPFLRWCAQSLPTGLCVGTA